MQTYELTLVLNATLEKAVLEKLLAKIKKLATETGGKVAKEEDWGKRLLAYPLKKQTEGLYYFWELEMDASKIKDLNQKLQIEEEVLRHLIIKNLSTKS